MKAVDLHVHSTCSDGTYTPTELVDYAIQKGLKAFALTDHDTVVGLAEAISYAADKDIEIIPGIELSTEYYGRDIHILGLFINCQSPSFRKHLIHFQDSRIERNHKMCKKLNEYGIDITYDKLVEEFPNCVITRAHYARYMLNHKYTRSMNEAFERYIGDHGPCFVAREKITPAQAVSLILASDGIPVLAHPTLYGFGKTELEKLIALLKENGLMGIESVYSTYSLAEEHMIKAFARKYDLLMTGGSDFHGSNKPNLDLAVGYGKLFVPEELLDHLKEKHSCMQKSIISLDMDGTLLNSEKRVSSETKKALDACVEAGHRIVISSGRPLASLQRLIAVNELNYPGLLVSAFNGGLVYDYETGVHLMEKTISSDLLRTTRYLAKEEQLHFHAYSLTDVVSERETEELHYYCNFVGLGFRIVNDLTQLPDFYPYKVFSIQLTDHSRLVRLREKIEDACGDSLQCVFSEPIFLEILPHNSGKGAALSFINRYLAIDSDHTYAFGDAENDITMFQSAGHAIAMKNANATVQNAADEVTCEDNDHDGLVPYFKRIMQSPK